MSYQHKTKLTREGWFYLVVLCFVLGGAVLREINLLFVLSGMLAGPLILSLRSVATALRGLQASRTLPQGVCAGESLAVEMQLQNTRRRVGGFAVTVEDSMGLAAAGEERHSVFFPYVAAGELRKRVYHARPERRGRYAVGPLRITTRFPFGLVQREIVTGGSDSLLIYPRMGRLTRLWTARRHEAFEGGRRQRQRYSRAEGEYYGVREWREGDSRRSIHWRSSARLGRLVVRQPEQPHTRDMAILVDLYAPGHAGNAGNAGGDDLQRVERIISFAATVAADVCRQANANLLLAVGGEETRLVRGAVSSALLQEVLRELAVCEASEKDRLQEMLAAAVDKIDAAAEVVLVSGRIPQLTGDARLAGLWNTAPRRSLLRRIRIVCDTDGFFAGEGEGAEGEDEEGYRNNRATGEVRLLSQYFQP